MSYWDTDIMSGDFPDHIQLGWEDQFGTGKVAPEDALQFATEYANSYPLQSEVVGQVVGYLVMQSQSKMSKKLRRLVVEGIDEEYLRGCVEWDDPSERKHKLNKFRNIVESYNKKGEAVTLPVATLTPLKEKHNIR